MLVINGLQTHGRPVEFDGDPALDNNATPTACDAQCPQCGDSMYVQLHGAAPHHVDCLDVMECRLRKRVVAAEPVSLPDPFRNPFSEGIMAVGDVDVSLVSALELPPPMAGTVADRIQFSVPPLSGDEP